ncbi:MAG: hypothetical protein UDG86_01795 [Lachnospiraceae bacterium]|jgi:hypothetical protein|nr:hypothetical protein [Lachnospiraceae bacterium]
MKLYKYIFHSNPVGLQTLTLDVHECPCTYVSQDYPVHRIRKSSIGTVNPESLELILTEENAEEACNVFARHFSKQAQVYTHLVQILDEYADILFNKEPETLSVCGKGDLH